MAWHQTGDRPLVEQIIDYFPIRYDFMVISEGFFYQIQVISSVQNKQMLTLFYNIT